MEKVLKYLSSIIKNGDKVGIALSGGMDSMCLLYLVCKFFDENNYDKKDINIININHKIRGKSSDSDSDFVRQISSDFNLSFTAFVVDVPSRCAVSRRSIESEARNARVEVFDRLRNAGVVDMMLTGHHALDQAETILLHAFRGTGIGGLVGMDSGADSRGKNYIYRPLLNVSKEEILDYVEANKIPYVTDETNSDSRYNRNFIRNEVLPLVRTRWKNADEALVNLGLIAAKNEQFIESLIDEKYIITVDSFTVRLHIDALKNDCLGAHYIFRALKKIGIQSDIEAKHFFLVFSLLSMVNGSILNLTGVDAVKEYDYITFKKREESESFSSPTSLTLPFENKSLSFNNFSVVVSEENFNHKNIQSKMSSGLGFFLGQSDRSKVLYIDKDKLPNCVIRSRRDGDEFKPYHGKTKKLKKYFIDCKIPLRIRDKIPLLCYNNKVLAILGIEISDDTFAVENSPCIKLQLLKPNTEI